MILRPAGRFLTILFPPALFAARFLAAVIRPPLLFLPYDFLLVDVWFSIELPCPYGTVTVLDWTVTAPEPFPPAPASNLPFTAQPSFTVMETAARILPLKMVVVPKVAELPTCQKNVFRLGAAAQDNARS